MRKLPVKTEYLVLGLVIVGLVLAISLRGTSRVRYKLPAVAKLEVAQISRITVVRAGGALELEKRDGLWRILPEGYKADESQLGTMVAALAGLEVTTMVSEAASYGRYGLDETGRMVITAYSGETQVRVVTAGKVDEGSKASFVLLPGDKKVYTARQNFRGLFDVDREKLRDMTVLQLDREQVVEIQARRGEVTLTLTRSTDESVTPAVTVWKAQTGEVWDPDVMSRFLGAVARMRAQRFGVKGEDLGAEQLNIFLKTADGAGATVAVHAKSGTQYGALTSQSEDPFYVAEYQLTDLSSIFDGKKAAED